MKYLSGRPFTAGANSRAYVERWEETFGRKNPKPTESIDLCDSPWCGIVENGSPCILPSGHDGKHYTAAEKDENLDFLVGLKLESRDWPQPCDGDGDVSSSKDRPPFSRPSLAKIERQAILEGLERRLKRVYLDRLSLTLTDEEILSLLLLFQNRRGRGIVDGGRIVPGEVDAVAGAVAAEIAEWCGQPRKAAIGARSSHMRRTAEIAIRALDGFRNRGKAP